MNLNMNLKISQRGVDLIKLFEGLMLTAYYCSGNVLTIGYGHTSNVKKDMRITKEQAEELLKKDLIAFENIIKTSVRVPLDQCEFDALVSLVFNIGGGNFRKSTLLKYLNNLYYDKAADEFLRWNRAGGNVIFGLTKRREAERNMFLEAQR